MSKVLVNCTHAKDSPERAILSFIAGNVAASADQETKVLLTIDGVWLATRGYASGVAQEGFPPLQEVIDSFVKNGGEIWACSACTNPRGITQEDMIPGAKIVTAANVVEYMVSGAATLGF
jgi:predicted peroxiredoxin